MHQLPGMRIFEALPHATITQRLGLSQAEEKGRKQARAIVGGSTDRRRRCNHAPLRAGQQNRSLKYLGQRHFGWDIQRNNASSAIHHNAQNVSSTPPFVHRKYWSLSSTFTRDPLSHQAFHTTRGPQPVIRVSVFEGQTVVMAHATHVFPADLPPWFFSIQPLRNLIPALSEPHNYIALDGPQRTYLRRPDFAGHGSDSLFEWRASRSRAIVRQLAVIQVTLEKHQVRMGKVQEQIWRFRV